MSARIELGGADQVPHIFDHQHRSLGGIELTHRAVHHIGIEMAAIAGLMLPFSLAPATVQQAVTGSSAVAVAGAGALVLLLWTAAASLANYFVLTQRRNTGLIAYGQYREVIMPEREPRQFYHILESLA